MTTVLLETLDNAVIDWMVTVGSQRDIAAGQILTCENRPLETFYVILEGSVTLDLPVGQPSSSASTVVSTVEQALIHLPAGEVTGAIPGLDSYLPTAIARAQSPTLVLAIPYQALAQKQQEDAEFAAKFYCAIAQVMAQRVAQLLQQWGHHPTLLYQMHLKDASTVFAGLQDNDLEWLITVGQVQQLGADTLLLRHDRPVDALHIVLDGGVELSPATGANPLATAFMRAETNPAAAVARLSRGDLVGESLLLGVGLPTYTARTVRESHLLSIPRWRLLAKLLYDNDFAARLYRVLAVLLANKQQQMAHQLGFAATTNELGRQVLEQVTLAEARFEWMLRRIQSRLHHGSRV